MFEPLNVQPTAGDGMGVVEHTVVVVVAPAR